MSARPQEALNEKAVAVMNRISNTLLQSDDATAKAHLSIQRYSVIPLSPNSGLIGCASRVIRV